VIPTPPWPAIPAAVLHRLVQQTRSPSERLYAIVDSARDAKLASIGYEQFNLERWWLFGSDTAPHMAPVAPYLIPVPIQATYPAADSGYLTLFAERLGNSVGILLTCAIEARTLWEHLRNLFHAVDEEGHEFYFRFYDPRVLRPFLPTMTPAEAREFFGPIRRILLESEKPGEMLVCRSDASGIRIDPQPLSEP